MGQVFIHMDAVHHGDGVFTTAHNLYPSDLETAEQLNFIVNSLRGDYPDILPPGDTPATPPAELTKDAPAKEGHEIDAAFDSVVSLCNSLNAAGIQAIVATEPGIMISLQSMAVHPANYQGVRRFAQMMRVQTALLSPETPEESYATRTMGRMYKALTLSPKKAKKESDKIMAEANASGYAL